MAISMMEQIERGVKPFETDTEALIAALRIAMRHDAPRGTAAMYVGPKDREAYKARMGHFARLIDDVEHHGVRQG